MKSAAYKYKDEQELQEIVKFLKDRAYNLSWKMEESKNPFIIAIIGGRKGFAGTNETSGIEYAKDLYGTDRTICSTKEEFMKLANELAPNPKPIEPDLPQTFAITGKPHQLASIYQDLMEMGYVKNAHASSSLPFLNFIGNNTIPFKIDKTHEHSFKQIYIAPTTQNNNSWHVKFNLPEDYSKALEFAKAQLNHPFWDKNAARKKEIDAEIAELNKDLAILNQEISDVRSKIDKLQGEKISL